MKTTKMPEGSTSLANVLTMVDGLSHSVSRKVGTDRLPTIDTEVLAASDTPTARQRMVTRILLVNSGIDPTSLEELSIPVGRLEEGLDEQKALPGELRVVGTANTDRDVLSHYGSGACGAAILIAPRVNDTKPNIGKGRAPAVNGALLGLRKR